MSTAHLSVPELLSGIGGWMSLEAAFLALAGSLSLQGGPSVKLSEGGGKFKLLEEGTIHPRPVPPDPHPAVGVWGSGGPLGSEVPS